METLQSIEYTASPTCSEFHRSDKFMRSMIGPIGSGKSVACCIEIFKKCCMQEPFLGRRESRWVIIRNTYRELIDTTMRTWFDWFPEDLGEFRKQDMEFIMEFSLADGTIVSSQILFRALDRPKDIKKLLSLELTGGWINEVKETPKAILDMLIGRVGRYPSKRRGGPSWWGVLMDTNPPDSDHWFFSLNEENLPPNASIHHQPSGIGPKAENIENLPAEYYSNMSHGKDPEWIKVYVMGEYGFVSDGLPVHPEFHDSLHVAKANIDYVEDQPLYIGVDFGRTPAATFAQEINGQICVIDELCTFGMGASSFGKLLAERIKGHYPNAKVIATGDPAGDHPGEQIDETCIDILRNVGIPIDPAYTNNFTIRRESLAISLCALTVQGTPQLIVSPKCIMLRKSLNGGYKYMRVQVSGEKFQNKPDKNKYSHVAESLHYLCIGLGKGYDVISSHSNVGNYKVIGSLQ